MRDGRKQGITLQNDGAAVSISTPTSETSSPSTLNFFASSFKHAQAGGATRQGLSELQHCGDLQSSIGLCVPRALHIALAQFRRLQSCGGAVGGRLGGWSGGWRVPALLFEVVGCRSTRSGLSGIPQVAFILKPAAARDSAKAHWLLRGIARVDL